MGQCGENRRVVKRLLTMQVEEASPLFIVYCSMLFHNQEDLSISCHSPKDRALTGDPPIPIDLQRCQARQYTFVLIPEDGTRTSTAGTAAKGATDVNGLQLRPSGCLTEDLKIGQRWWLRIRKRSYETAVSGLVEDIVRSDT